MTVTKKNFLISIVNHFIQGIIVFLSVFFAFWLTNYKEEVEQKENIETSMRNIANEIRNNHIKIEKTFEYHLGIVRRVDSIKLCCPEKYNTLTNKDIQWEGVNLPRLNAEAYHVLINSGLINSIEFQKQKLLFETYEYQLILSDVEKTFFTQLFNKDKRDSEKYYQMSSLLIDILPGILIKYQTSGKKLLSKYNYNSPVKGKLNDFIDPYIKEIKSK